MKQRYYVSAIAIVTVAAALVGCGGGGGSSSPATTTSLSNMSTNSFVFAPVPTSSSAPMPVNPASGTYAGGTIVTINGSGKVTAPVTVYFGNTPGVNTYVVSSSTTNTSINVIAPAGTPGTTVDVRVVDANGVSAISANDQYLFVPPPPGPPASSSSAAKPAHS